MMAGWLLARQGVRVTVLEKHADFFRDFRGDTVHPSTLQLFVELGLIDRLLAIPHSQIDQLSALIEGETYHVVDLRHLPVDCRFFAMMPQWDLLNFIAAEARQLPSFTLRMGVEATGLVQADGRVTGLRIAGGAPIAADLTVLADGRNSTIKREAGLVSQESGVPIDVLWFRLPKRPGEVANLANIASGAVAIQIDRMDYWQCALVIGKGEAGALEASGLSGLAERVGRAAPHLRERVLALSGWDAVKLLTVRVDWLDRWWSPGLIAIGDAAHAMSPIGGVGINFAVQDAVALSNILGPSLARGEDVTARLAEVEDRRKLPARMMQRFQVLMQDNVLKPALSGGSAFTPPLPIRIIDHVPLLRRVIGRALGMGFRPEHIQA
jgi:2-polyprenyl-6-methoxyphenol hydroxylase-like FAD-dependent oxidoreductase